MISLIHVDCEARCGMSCYVMLDFVVCRKVSIFVICLKFFEMTCIWHLLVAELDLLLF
jgi:hypothetical protein